MKKLILIILSLIMLSGCVSTKTTMESAVTESMTIKAEITTEAETTTISVTTGDNWYNYESICSYIEARTAALKDNSGISVTLCDEIKAFLSGKKDIDALSKHQIIYDNCFSFDYHDAVPIAPISTLTFTKPLGREIFCGLDIGSPMSEIEKKFGIPNNTTYEKSGRIYYFDGYSVMFYGTDRIKYIGIAKMPELDKSYNGLLDYITKKSGAESLLNTEIL